MSAPFLNLPLNSLMAALAGLGLLNIRRRK